MVKSMTGYGRGEETAQGTTVTVELRAVNNRYLDCTVKMPRTYIFAEDALKELVQSKVSRGKVDVFVNVAHEGGDDVTVTVNESLARAYVRAMLQLERLRAEEGNRTILSDYKTADLARFPDVLTVEKKEEDQDQVKALLLAALIRGHWPLFTGLNLALAVFNLLPLGRLDGGRMLRCCLSMALGPEGADRAAQLLDRGLAGLLLLLGLWAALRGGNPTLLLTALWLCAADLGDLRRKWGKRVVIRGRKG